MATLTSTGRFAAGEACADNDILYGPYATTAAAHAALLNAEQNVVGRTVGIQSGNTIEEYWYQGGSDQVHLVKKQSSEVEANPTGEAITPLNKIKIGETNYNIPQTDTSNLATKQELQQGLAGKQDTISASSKISSDFVDDTDKTHKFVTSTEKGLIGTAIQGVKKGNETLTPEDGVVTIPSDIESAQATSVSSNQSATATIDSNHVLQIEIPRGADAVNPFKGYFDSLSDLQVKYPTGEAGDFANVYDSTADKTYRYVWDASLSTPAWAQALDSSSNPIEVTPDTATFATGQSVIDVPIDNTNLENPASGALTKAEDAALLKQGKIDKVEQIEVPIYTELEPASGEGITGTYEGHYIGNNASIISSATGYTVKQFPVTPGEKYYISGSTGTSSGNNLAWFINDFTKTGAGGSNNAAVGDGILKGANVTATRYEVTAPVGAIGIRIMQRDSVTDYQIKCEVRTITYTYKYNQDIIDSVGDVDDLETTNRETVVGAINELAGEISDLSNDRKSLKVLLIGSSHGVNTISMFPVLAYHAGIDITVGNLYAGSATLGLYSARPGVQIPYMADNDVSFGRFAVYENGAWGTKSTSTISYALSEYQWDAIILQRGASEDYWDNSIANFYQHLLDYVKDNCDYNPRIYFNSGIANAYRQVDGDYQDTCLKETNILMETAYEQEAEFGITVIPTAVAVQYARKTCLRNTGQYLGSSNQYQCMACDAQHLDTGVGQYVTACTVFERVAKDFFNISVRELDYLPTYSDVSGNVVNEGSEYFTPITEYYSRIAKTCASLAVIDKEVKSETTTMLASRYGNLPTTYNITYNLTGCMLDVDDATIDSDDVFMARLTLESGYTMPEGGVVVTVGGNDVTSTVYAAYDGYYAIRIGEITGNIVITASAS